MRPGLDAKGYYRSMQAYYEWRATEYDDAYAGTGAYSRQDRSGFETALAAVTSMIRELPPARVLDVACGTGFITRHLKGEVVGLDQSESMLEIARERVPTAVFRRGDALDLPFADLSFDRVFTGNFYGLLLPPERVRFLAEARRVAPSLVVFETSLAALRTHAQGWQERTLSDGSHHRIYRRYFAAEDLAAELGDGRVLFDDEHFVLVAS